MARLPLCLMVLAAAGGTAAAAREEVVPASAGSDWRSAATQHDRGRLRHWRDAWADALAQVGRGPDAAEIARGGALFEPDAALPGAEPPPGDYHCRTVKLGRAERSTLDYVAYPASRCRIARAAGRLHFTVLAGVQRRAGTIFPDNGRRMIFLGTLMLGDETRALRYGRDRERDLIGLVERVGPERWRIAFPRPHYESLLDVIELVPRR
ncbi:MAG TPA: DUF4893 domain-containing protein [Allosphingosinicella sp.]|nr:DUF4893 domain-containing protein [Allosphingosinicella sp.]